MIFEELDDHIPTDDADKRTEEVVIDIPEASLPIEDDELNHFIDQKVKDAEKFKSDKKIEERQKKLVKYYLGNQVDEDSLDTWQSAHIDNVLRRDEEVRINLAASRMPDIIVSPSNDTMEDRDRAKKYENFLSKRLKSSDTQRAVEDGLRQHDLKFTAALKVRWDKGKKDFTYDLIRPENMVFDTSAPIPHDGYTPDNMDFVAHWIEEPASVVMAKFPQKKEIIRELSKVGGDGKRLAGKIRYLEAHFTYHDKEGMPIEGVAWRYKNEILGKEKQPYFDWEGYDDVVQDEMGGFTLGKKFRNHFDRPHKPFIFFSEGGLNISAYDDTTIFEQAISKQNILNKRRRQITEIADNSIPRLIFAGDLIDKEQAQRVSNDPSEHIWIDGAQDARAAVQTVQAEPPHPILIQDAASLVIGIDADFSTQATTRGQTTTNESGISKQISREGDLATSDAVSRRIIERVMFELANWSTQMIKMFYDEAHYVREMGEDGEMTYVDMSQDQVDDGINVNVRSSTTDKQTRRAQALELAGMEGIDPLTLAQDLELPNPKERTARLIAFQNGPQDGYARYQAVIGIDANTPGGQNEEVEETLEPELGPGIEGLEPAMAGMEPSLTQEALGSRMEI